MGLRRSVIHGILLGFPFFAVYIYRTIYRANYFSGTADFVHFQLTFGALAALCAYLFLYKCVVAPLWDFIRHGTKQRVLHVNSIFIIPNHYFPYCGSMMKTSSYPEPLAFPGDIPEFDLKKDRLEVRLLEKSRLIVSVRILHDYHRPWNKTTHLRVSIATSSMKACK